MLVVQNPISTVHLVQKVVRHLHRDANRNNLLAFGQYFPESLGHEIFGQNQRFVISNNPFILPPLIPFSFECIHVE